MQEMLLRSILAACDGSVIAFRQKALKALAGVVERDPSLFTQVSKLLVRRSQRLTPDKPEIERTLEQRMLDQSPAVRDAALELLSRYVAYNAKLASQYLPRILLRVAVSASLVTSKTSSRRLHRRMPVSVFASE